MFKIKLYKYDSSQEQNGYRGEDFSKHILQGGSINEAITQELDTAEITLCGLAFDKCFDPETKFILDVVEQNDGVENVLRNYHFCVFEDIVSQPILSNNNYFDHHISFIEPSVVAQKRLVDNIATTYKIKDVSLKERVDYPDTKIVWDIDNSYFTPPYYTAFIGSTTNLWGGSIPAEIEHPIAPVSCYRGVMGKYFRKDGELRAINTNGVEFDTAFTDIENFNDGNGNYKARFKIPKIEVIKGYAGTDDWGNATYDLGDEVIRLIDPMYVSIDYVIQELVPNDPSNVTDTHRGSFISNSRLGWSSWSEDINSANFSSNYPTEILDEEWFLEEIKQPSNRFEFYYKKYTETSAPTPTYITQEIPIRPDRQYVITISLHQFEDNLPSKYNGTRRYKYTGTSIAKYINAMYYAYGVGEYYMEWLVPELVPIQQRLTSTQVSNKSNELSFYSADTVKEIVYTSASPYSALSLLQKAIINSSTYEKQQGVFIGDINNSNTPFYISNEYVDDFGNVNSVIDDLRRTTIIENFYNQKNLWEVMIEVGHYIHAIPEIRFGADDKFLITFNRLGRTDEKQSSGDKMSIYNSRSVEDYVCATSSYIENMVQLGGVIEEYVAPKTTNDQLLVSNDTAEIIVTKPIIELMQVEAIRKSDGLSADLTQFIYEENVYKTLSIDYQIEPNRGIAMYYKLGTNVITGGQYQLPQSNTNMYTDYAFKKIIYSAYHEYPVINNPPSADGYWGNIKVTDYIFKVRYRTKDSVRQNHIRPDIRKYLLNSKYDKFPEHNQFNNQTDIVVDSIKFGNNMFGKLIKTGNNNYTISSWYDNFSKIKKKGELYRINGELNYVAKTTTEIFSSCILQSVKFSKDYNELSAIIGIPSEPRFFEIGEQSLIWREFAINDILLLTDDPDELSYGSNFVFNYEHLSALVIGGGADFAKYALTVFKGDKDVGVYNQDGGQPNLYKELLHPINAYSSENTLTYEWDMTDNYSAGDKVISTTKENYLSLWAVPYTDIYGKAALLDFYILGDVNWGDNGNLSSKDIQDVSALPQSPIKTKNNDNTDTRPFVGNFDILGTNVKAYDENFNERGLGLLKDCREAISVNFNLQLATNSDTFVISPFVFSPNKKNLKIVLLSNEVNKLSDGYIDNGEIIVPLDNNGQELRPYFDGVEYRPFFEYTPTKSTSQSTWNSSKQVWNNFGIDISTILANVNEGHFNNDPNFVQVKSIAIICNVAINATNPDDEELAIPNKSKFVIARNIPADWDKSKATSPIYFGAPNKNAIFKNKQ